MTFALTGWMVYMMWAVLGLMWLDFLISFVRSLFGGSFNITLALDYLKDMLYYVLPLFLIVTLMPLDPFGGWIMTSIFGLGSLGVVVHYVTRLSRNFK